MLQRLQFICKVYSGGMLRNSLPSDGHTLAVDLYNNYPMLYSFFWVIPQCLNFI